MDKENGQVDGGQTLEQQPKLPEGYEFVGDDNVSVEKPIIKDEPPKEEPEETETSEAEPEEERSEGEKKRRRGGFTKKIDKLTAERDALLEIVRQTQQGQQKVEPKADSPLEKPKLENFTTYEAYTEALAEYTFEQKLAKHNAKSKEETAKAENEKRLETYRKSEDAVREKFQDFDEVVQSYDGPTSPLLNEAILSSEFAAELTYNLAKQPELIAKLNTMNAIQLGREIGKIENTLSSKTTSTKAAAKVTNAPQPIKPVGAKKSTETFDLNSDFTMEEFRAARAKGLV